MSFLQNKLLPEKNLNLSEEKIRQLSSIHSSSKAKFDIKLQLRINKEKLVNIRKNEIEFINRRSSLIKNKVKEIDENVKKLKKVLEYSFPKLVRINKSISSHSILPIKNSVNNLSISQNEKKIIISKSQIKISEEESNEIGEVKEELNDHLSTDKSIENINQSPDLENDKSKEIQIPIETLELPLIEIIEKNNSPDLLEIETLENQAYKENQKENLENPEIVKPVEENKPVEEKKNENILFQIDPHDRNYKKLLKMKNYDHLVSNLSHITEFLIKNNREKSGHSKNKIKKENKIKGNKSLNIQTFKKESKMDEDSSRLIKNYGVPGSNNHSLKNEKSFSQIFSRNNNSSQNLDLNISNSLKIEKPKILDRYQAKLNKLYNINPQKIEELKKIKQLKNLPLEEYQKRLIVAASKCISNESISDLHKKFDDIKNQNKIQISNDYFNPKEKLNELRNQVDLAEKTEFRNIKEKFIVENPIIKRKYEKKIKKIDENLKKISKYIPADLFDKLKLL